MHFELKEFQHTLIICNVNCMLSLLCITISFVSVDGRKLVSCGNDGFLKIFDVNTGAEVYAKNSNSQLK